MPYIRSWVGEIWGPHPNYQYRSNGYVSQCGDLELNFLECFEAYGREKGHHVCQDFYEDFRECVWGFNQRRRANIMHTERVKQVVRGDLKPTEIYGPKISRISYIRTALNP